MSGDVKGERVLMKIGGGGEGGKCQRGEACTLIQMFHIILRMCKLAREE